MAQFKFDLIKHHFEIEVNNETNIIRSLISNKNIEELVDSPVTKYKSEIKIFITALQKLLELDKAELSNGEIKIDHLNLCNLDVDSQKYLNLPENCNFRLDISQEGVLGKKNFYFNYKFLKNFREINFNRIGCFIKVGSIHYLLTSFHYDILEALDDFNRLSDSEKEGVEPWKNLVNYKNLSNSIDIIFSQYLDQQNVVVPSKMSLSIEEDQNNSFILKPVFDEIENESFLNTYEYFNTAQNSYSFKSDDGKKIRLIIPPEIKENIEVLKERPKLRTEKEKKLFLEKPDAFFPNPDLVSLEDLSDRVIGFGVYEDGFFARPSSGQIDWDHSINISLKTVSGEDISLEILDKDEAKEITKQVKKAIKEEKPFIELQGKTIPLSPNNLDNLRDIFIDDQEITTEEDDDISKEETEEKKEESVHLIIDENEVKTRIQKAEKELILKLELPSALKQDCKLKHHQEIGLAWLQNSFYLKDIESRKGVLLADDMGLGKTLQILSFILWLYEKNKISNQSKKAPYKPFLIVAPVILLENWKDEYYKFCEPLLGEPFILHGDNLKNLRIDKPEDNFKGREYIQSLENNENPKHYLNLDAIKSNKIIITNYDTLVNYQFSLGLIDWSLLVLDEAQEIKEGKSYKSRIAKSLKSDFKIACTGTPVENTLMDLWNIFDFLQHKPALLPPAKEFASKFEKDVIEDKTQELHSLIRYHDTDAFILRRTKSGELKDALPDKVILPPYKVPLSQKQLELYNSLKISLLTNKKTTLSILNEISKLHQHPRLLSSENITVSSPKQLIKECPKFEKLIEIMEKVKQKKEKALIFCLYHRLQDYLKLVLEDTFNIKVDIVNGTSKGGSYRQKLINNFQKESNTFNVLILSPKAAGVGLNITGANHVIHYGRWWNPAKENQATDRVYRIGQTKNVYIYYLLAIDPNNKFKTFDEKLDELIKNKTCLAENFLIPSKLLGVEKELVKSISEEAIEDNEPVTSGKNCIDFNFVKNISHDNFEVLTAFIYDKLGYKTILCPVNFPGLDVIAYNDNEFVFIQCKHTTTGNIKDSEAIENVLDGKDRIINMTTLKKDLSLICLTNSKFDKESQEYAKKVGVKLFDEKFFKEILKNYPISEADIAVKQLERRNMFSEVFVEIKQAN